MLQAALKLQDVKQEIMYVILSFRLILFTLFVLARTFSEV